MKPSWGLLLAGGLGLALTLSACSDNGSPSAARVTTTTTSPPTPGATPSSATSTTAPGTTTTQAPGTGGSGASGGSSGSRTLGVSGAFGSSGVGFGEVKPAEISLGGDPTGVVTGITWQSWGGGQATGTGRSTYVGPNQTVAQGTVEAATVVAFDPGTCKGAPAYQEVKWYFPEEGETLASGSNSIIDACTGP